MRERGRERGLQEESVCWSCSALRLSFYEWVSEAADCNVKKNKSVLKVDVKKRIGKEEKSTRLFFSIFEATATKKNVK